MHVSESAHFMRESYMYFMRVPCIFHPWHNYTFMHGSYFYAFSCMKHAGNFEPLLNYACYMYEVPHYIILIRSSYQYFTDLKKCEIL